MRRSSVQCSKSILCAIAEETLSEIEKAGTYKSERILTTPQRVLLQTTQQPGRSVLNMCANNYLGLADHPLVIQAAKTALDQFGFGMSSVRFICGTSSLHKEYEARLASLLGKEDAILYPSCFDANAGLFECLLSEKDLIVSDALNHASLIDGIRLCKAKKERYRHMDMTHLEEILSNARSAGSVVRAIVIVTDGVFSMDGDIAPLPAITNLAEKYKSTVLVDDSHATGYFGPDGKGTAHYFGVQDKVEIVTSTLGKALGGASGGFCAGPRSLIELQRQKSRPYLFSNSVPPSVIAGSMKAFEMATGAGSEFRTVLARNVTLFRSLMKKHHFRVLGDDKCAIAPVWLGDARVASEFSARMLKKGVYVIGFSFPVVPKSEARIRVQLSAAHSEADIKMAVEAFVQTREELQKEGIIPVANITTTTSSKL